MSLYKTQRVQRPDGTIQEIKVKSIGEQVRREAAQRKAKQRADRQRAQQQPPPQTPPKT